MRTASSRRPYHDWASSTPVLDVAVILVAVASVMIVAYDLIFLAFAVRDDDWGLALKYAAIAVVVGAANLAMHALRRWWRHHG
jgi:hypothetical protein